MTLVPNSRLLFWFAVVALPFSVLGALYPVAGPFAVVLIAGLVVLALVDAAVSYGRLDGIRVQLPEVLRLSKDRAGSIEVTRCGCGSGWRCRANWRRRTRTRRCSCPPARCCRGWTGP